MSSNPFAKMTTEGLEETQDTLGGFAPAPSDVYAATVTMAYAGEAASGAQNVTIIAKAGTTEFRETVYVTNKKGENFYTKDGKKNPLPGYTTVDDICLLTTESPLSEQNVEMKMVKVWNSDEKKELPAEVPVLIDMIGKPVNLAVLRVKEFKQKKGDDGKYHDTDEVRVSNAINKAFHAETNKTVNEYRQEVENAEFYESWVERNKGKDRDKTAGKGNSGPGSSGSGKPGGDATPKKKLFG